MNTYVHGYSPREGQRLEDQAGTLAELLHADSYFAPGSRILEAGCGGGAQTVTLARQNPDCRFTCIDISPDSVEAARRRVQAEGLTNVELRVGALRALPFAPASFDHVFVCFVLEHLREPVRALATLSGMLVPGGTITVIEGDHGSTFFHPDCPDAHRAIACQVELQSRAGGDANIGRRLFPLLAEAGYEGTSVSPRMVYVDGSRPAWVEGFILQTFTAMIEGVREQAIGAGLVDAATFDRGVRGLRRTAEVDGVFCYTFFRATARKRTSSI